MTLHFGPGAQELTIEYSEAKKLIAGYAFGDRPLEFKKWTPSYGELPPSPRVRCWGYRSYDCVTASVGQDLEPLDLFFVSGLNVEVDIKAIEAFRVVKDQVADAVANISDGLKFWDLSTDDLQSGTVDDPTDAWWLYRAWWLLMSTPRLGPTTTHKVLHHKWPHLFPLLDAETLKVYQLHGAWAGVLTDLHSQPEVFQELEDWFAGLAGGMGGVELTRLRLHDIVLWSLVTKNAAACIDVGAPFVS